MIAVLSARFQDKKHDATTMLVVSSGVGSKRRRAEDMIHSKYASDISLSVSRRKITPTSEQTQHALHEEAEQCARYVDPIDSVRCKVAQAIDESNDSVDLSHYGLSTIPDCIQDLKYLVSASSTCFSDSLKLFLSFNQLSDLPMRFFQLTNLTVLSLRHNSLSCIPPEVGQLRNLKEVHIGNNNLAYIPFELTQAPGITIASVHPNPFITCSKVKSDSAKTPGPAKVVPLQELIMRQIISSAESHRHLLDLCSHLPPHIQDVLIKRYNVRSSHVCAGSSCNEVMVSWCVSEIVPMDVWGNHQVPVLKRFCSQACAWSKS